MNYRHFSRFSSHEAFIDKLAAYILATYGQDPVQLTRLLVLLPSRRSCRHLQDAFLRASGGKPLLLPAMRPIGELSEEDDFSTFFTMQDEDTLPVLSSKTRQAMLAALIRKYDNSPPSRSFRLAGALASLLDEVTKHQLSFSGLGKLVPEELSKHWQKTLDFLALITTHWPRILSDIPAQDQVTAQRDQTLSLARLWQQNPPDFPIIAAGSTGSIPATAALLNTIGRLPQGRVILSGLDTMMPESIWDMIDPTHPQYALKQLLVKCELTRSDIEVIGNPTPDNKTLQSIFTPAPTTGTWKDSSLSITEDLAHIKTVTASTQLDEARMIAVALREVLDTEGKTAALITPDRGLAQKVANELLRYDISIDDTAGIPLRLTPTAVFLSLINEVIASGFAPGPLLALLRHPLAALGQDPAITRDYSRKLELELLRGIRLQSGMDSIVQEAAALPANIQDWLKQLAAMMRPLEIMWLNNQENTLDALIDVHCEIAEQLATTADEHGAQLLWAKDSGNQLAELLRNWQRTGGEMGEIAAHDYPALFEALLETETYRPRYGLHPRLHILSPIEARLCQYDLVILGEMSEGVWPSLPSADPWMSIPMREKFGLPKAGFTIGQAAHDVWMLMQSPEVLLTRARKTGGSPAIASRWWVRLFTLIEGKAAGFKETFDRTAHYQAIIDAQNAAYDIPQLARPTPIPPEVARPHNIAVTMLQQFAEDPYRYYARAILKLRSLDALDQEPGGADFGNVIHAALEHFLNAHPDELPEHAYQTLLNFGKNAFGPLLHKPAVQVLWWPRFEAIARAFLKEETKRRAENNYHSICEIKQRYHTVVDGKEVTLTAKADRIDISKNWIRLIDYKTGAVASAKAIREGTALQLPLTAMVLQHATPAILPEGRKLDELVYWGLKGTEDKNIWEAENYEEALEEQTREHFETAMRYILSANTDFAPAYVTTSRFNDGFAYLIRKQEWLGKGTNADA